MADVCGEVATLPSRSVPVSAPVLAVCGFSGSGKTTLLEAAIPQLTAGGLSVAVIKHDAHGFTVDQPGKDSDRLFRAGATVVLRGPNEQVQRRAAGSALSLFATIADLARHHDLILVEGHKDTPLPKVWLEDASRNQPPSQVANIVATLKRDSQRLPGFLDYVNAWLPRAWKKRPLYLGLLMPRTSMERGPRLRKFFEPGKYRVWRQYAGCGRVLTLGAGPVPDSLAQFTHLPNAPECENGYAALIAAHRWAPEAAWIVATWGACRLAYQDVASLRLLRCPGKWAATRCEPGDRPALALYEPQLLVALEEKLMEEPGWDQPITTLLDRARIAFAGNPPPAPDDMGPAPSRTSRFWLSNARPGRSSSAIAD